MKTPKVSVIVPVYQAEAFLEACLKSILGQTFSDFELLLIDDGSEDRSGIICDQYAKADNRIMVLHKQNSGVSAARNAGLEICKGELITFVDADDTVDSCFLESAVGAMSEGSADLFLSGMYMEIWKNHVMQESIQYGIRTSGSYTVKALLEELEKKYPQICICGPCCKLYKNEIIREYNIRFPKLLEYGEDTYFNLEYLAHCRRVFFSQECFYHYRRANEAPLFSRFHEDTYEVHELVYSKMRALMQQLGCCKTAMYKFESFYFCMLLGGIHEYYRFSEKTTAQERLHHIIKVAGDPCLSKVKLQYLPGIKTGILYGLLRFKMYSLIALIFEIKYR